jgi:membrane carboxypeptidase/penicillin-binding protein
MTKYRKVFTAVLAAAILFLPAAPALAESGGAGGTSGRVSDRVRTEAEHQTPGAETEAEHLATPAQHQEDKQQTETENHDNACTNKRRVVGNTLSRIANRGQRQMDVFTKIADRTKKFKENKNLTVNNYDGLLASVNDKQTAAENTLSKIKADASAAASLSCDSGQPKAVVGGFRDDLKAENNALKAYKTAIKNLIVAVKSAQSATEAQQ